MIVLTELVDGEPTIVAAEGLALALGVSVGLIRVYARRGLAFPHIWLLAGQRRDSEAIAATGRDDLYSVLSYWARKELGVETVDLGGGRLALA